MNVNGRLVVQVNRHLTCSAMFVQQRQSNPENYRNRLSLCWSSRRPPKFARAVPAPLRPRPLVEESKLNRGHAARGARQPYKLDGASGNVSSSRSHVWHSWERSRMSGAQLKRIGNYQLSVWASHEPQTQPTTKYIEHTRCASSLSTSTSPARKLHKQVTDDCDTLRPFSAAAGRAVGTGD